MNSITDLTESDFIPELKLGEKIQIMETSPNDCHGPKCSYALPEILKKPLAIKPHFIKNLFLGYLIIKFIRKLKNSIIFPIKVAKELKNKKFLLMNDISFFPEGLSTQKIKKVPKLSISISQFVSIIKESFLLKFVRECAKKVPFFDDFSLFIKIWDVSQLVLIFIVILVIPINIFLYDLPNIQSSIFIKAYDNILIVCLTFFSMDIIMKFNRRVFTKGVVVSRLVIAQNYVKTFFFVDFVSTFSLIFCNFLPSFSLLFLLKISYFQNFNHILNSRYIKYKYSPLIIELLIKLVYILLLSHYMACIWCKVGDYGSANYIQSWILDVEMADNQYVYAFFFCFQILVFDGNSLIQPTNLLELFWVFIFKMIALFYIFYVIVHPFE